jgi:hypothetical protein
MTSIPRKVKRITEPVTTDKAKRITCLLGEVAC